MKSTDFPGGFDAEGLISFEEITDYSLISGKILKKKSKKRKVEDTDDSGAKKKKQKLKKQKPDSDDEEFNINDMPSDSDSEPAEKKKEKPTKKKSKKKSKILKPSFIQTRGEFEFVKTLNQLALPLHFRQQWQLHWQRAESES
jgi:hypothetical protein